MKSINNLSIIRRKIKPYDIGLTFGVYDLIHGGHVNLLKNAKELCEKLIVCVSTDDYVSRHKGSFAFIPLNERLNVVRAIKYVDVVDIQSLEFGKAEAVAKYNPDVLFVGDDWTPETYTGMKLGVPVEFLQYTKGISSTLLREEIGRKLIETK